jgi:hypothetical protein
MWTSIGPLIRLQRPMVLSGSASKTSTPITVPKPIDTPDPSVTPGMAPIRRVRNDVKGTNDTVVLHGSGSLFRPQRCADPNRFGITEQEPGRVDRLDTHVDQCPAAGSLPVGEPATRAPAGVDAVATRVRTGRPT